MDTVPLSAAIVQRVSDPRRSLGASTNDQETENRAACDRHGWTVAPEAVFTEEQSASRFATRKRKEWKRLTAAVSDGRYGVVVIWESSRADRTPDTWFPFLTACRETGTLIYVTSHDRAYDMRNWREWRTMAEEGVDAAAEVEKLSDRVKRGLRANVAAGKPHGRIVYGYERIYDEHTKRLIEQRAHPMRAPVVREIKASIAAGIPVSVITADLNDRGLKGPGGGPWYREAVRQIGLNPVYIGKRYWRGDGELHDGNWPAIVDAGIHYAAVAVLSDPARKTTRPGSDRHMLSYVLECAECGRPMFGHRASEKNRLAAGYRCPAGCTAARQEWLDAFISRLVIRRLSQPGAYAALTRRDDTETAAARDELAALKARLDAATGSYRFGRIGIGQLEEITADLRPQIAKAEQRVTALTAAAPVWMLLSAEEDITQRWERMGPAQRKAVIRALFSRIALKKAARKGEVRILDPARVEFEWRD